MFAAGESKPSLGFSNYLMDSQKQSFKCSGNAGSKRRASAQGIMGTSGLTLAPAINALAANRQHLLLPAAQMIASMGCTGFQHGEMPEDPVKIPC